MNHKPHIKTWLGITLIVLILLTLLSACSMADIESAIRTIKGRDTRVVKKVVAKKAMRYATDPDALKRDVAQFKARFQKQLDVFHELIRSIWGEKKPKTPSKKEYVKYTQQYESRAIVNFEKGLITVETLDEKDPKGSLRKAIVSTLLTPYDPGGVDLYSDKEIKFTGKPYLYGEVKDQDGKNIRWKWRAERFAKHLVTHNLKIRPSAMKEGPETVYYVHITMVKSHLGIRAEKYKPQVKSQAKRFGVNSNLVYAIMETESSFNPYAVSNAPAFGLMQIVPVSAGRDAWRFLKNQDGIPSKQYLFNAENNIEMGTAYLYLLDSRYLDAIKNPASREYCVIAAYNTGSGNVLRTFSRDRKKAVDIINRTTPDKIYEKLRASLPSREARRYVMKVTEAKKRYVRL
jgi:membrane-bound lytic murein transglycosylase C